VLRTRSPRAHPVYCYTRLRVRLACVKHAASVRSEPGSNSRLKLVHPISPVDAGFIPVSHWRYRGELLNRSVLKFPSVRMRGRTVKPNGFWLVSSDCQRAGTPRPAGRDSRQTLILHDRHNMSIEVFAKFCVRLAACPNSLERNRPTLSSRKMAMSIR
jgi:hypothetical protein